MTIDTYTWLFPTLFMFHDMEEIIGLRSWLIRNESILAKRFPKIAKLYKNFTTEGFAVAVFEELCVCILFCLLTSLPWMFFKLLWMGAFMAYTLHLVVHVVQAILFRGYIPALATSLLCLPVSTWIIYACWPTLTVSPAQSIVAVPLGILLTALNLRFAQSLIPRFKLEKRTK